MSELAKKLRDLAERLESHASGHTSGPISHAKATVYLSIKMDLAPLLAEAERLEAKARNWRIGMAVTPKLKSHPFFGRVGVIREIVDVGNSEPRGRSEKLMVDVWGQFAVHKLTEPADDWKTA